jgi:hypothetical protein
MKKLFLVGAATLGLSAPLAAHADVQVYVGYADGLRAGADFPNPFAPGETFNNGVSTFNIALQAGELANGNSDSGAIMLLNTGATTVTVDSLSVNNRGNGAVYNLWGSGAGFGLGNLGSSGFSLAPGQGIIFDQTNGQNFDSSDSSSAAFTGASQTGTTFDPSTNNCSTGAIAASAACTSTSALVTFNIDGSNQTFTDTGHVLDTGGYDSAGFNHIHTGGSGVTEFNTNESLNWRPIGTTGINNPGGGNAVPEPMTAVLLGTGLLGLELIRRRRRR